MSEAFHLQEPLVCGNRTIIPVVSGTLVCHEHGVAGSLLPVALLIGENGSWSIALLEGDSVVALLEKIVLPA